MASVRGQPGILQSESRAAGVPLFRLESGVYGCRPPPAVPPVPQAWEAVTSGPGREQTPETKPQEPSSTFGGGGQQAACRKSRGTRPLDTRPGQRKLLSQLRRCWGSSAALRIWNTCWGACAEGGQEGQRPHNSKASSSASWCHVSVPICGHRSGAGLGGLEVAALR